MLETMAEDGNVGDHGCGWQCWRPWLRMEMLETMAEEGNVGDHG